jgi:hypothetical protein
MDRLVDRAVLGAEAAIGVHCRAGEAFWNVWVGHGEGIIHSLMQMRLHLH